MNMSEEACQNQQSNVTLTIDQKNKFYKLMQNDAKKKKYFNEYMREYRRKKREQGIHEPTVRANTAPCVYNHMYKQDAILCIKYLFK